MATNNVNNIPDIPADKFRFATGRDFKHDSKFDTKPVSYFQGALKRFSKNKGAVVGGIVIAVLALFAIIAPFFTPFTPAYYDMVYAYVTPKSHLFADNGIDFWDGCKTKNTNYLGYIKDVALAAETGREVIKRGEYTVSEDGTNYSYRYDTYYGVGFGKYKVISQEEFDNIQKYQNETGRQVLYPIVKATDRPTLEKNKYDANIYYKVVDPNASTVRPKLDYDGNIIPNYWKYEVGSASSLIPEYNSLRIEGENGISQNGTTYYYAYGRRVDGGIEVRAEYYEYYSYNHSQVKKDGIEEPIFFFGTTDTGKDIFACLAYGARFSFMFSIVVAAVNFIVGVIWGSISGYFGGRIDLFMERFSDILGAVPTMIVITLLKYHMGTSSQALVPSHRVLCNGVDRYGEQGARSSTALKIRSMFLREELLGAGNLRIMFKHIFPNGPARHHRHQRCSGNSFDDLLGNQPVLPRGIVNLEAGNTTSVGTLISAGQKSIMAGAGDAAPPPLCVPCSVNAQL